MAFRDRAWEIKSRYMKDILGGHDDKIHASQFLSSRITYLKRERNTAVDVLEKQELDHLINTYQFLKKQMINRR